jgi:hypothetical protein
VALCSPLKVSVQRQRALAVGGSFAVHEADRRRADAFEVLACGAQFGVLADAVGSRDQRAGAGTAGGVAGGGVAAGGAAARVPAGGAVVATAQACAVAPARRAVCEVNAAGAPGPVRARSPYRPAAGRVMCRRTVRTRMAHLGGRAQRARGAEQRSHGKRETDGEQGSA